MTTRNSLARLLPSLGLVALLGGCAYYDDVSSYGHYNGVVGVGTGYGYGYGPGWHDGFYYPGSGLWAYDRGGKRHRWHGRDHNGNGGRPGDGRAGIGHGGDHARPGGWRGGRRRDAVAGTSGVTAPGTATGGGSHWRDRSGAANQLGPARAIDATPRPPRPSPVERASRPTREGRNAQERPD